MMSKWNKWRNIFSSITVGPPSNRHRQFGPLNSPENTQPNGRIKLRDVISLLLFIHALLVKTMGQNKSARWIGGERAQRSAELLLLLFYCIWHSTDINTRIIYPVLWRTRTIFLGIFLVFLCRHTYTIHVQSYATCVNALGPIVCLLRNSIPFSLFYA